eukprot:TRINITY_DN11500_c0_g1_i2.p1 TRINITY_DN11500_c0_g1~~TRINITY_DN11500_c0_g1_i2.p1  ORF type:complete len:297 (-),score=15.01 TRINITY_DN11500_c0_g1_i2:24-914(-)
MKEFTSQACNLLPAKLASLCLDGFCLNSSAFPVFPQSLTSMVFILQGSNVVTRTMLNAFPSTLKTLTISDFETFPLASLPFTNLENLSFCRARRPYPIELGALLPHLTKLTIIGCSPPPSQEAMTNFRSLKIFEFQGRFNGINIGAIVPSSLTSLTLNPDIPDTRYTLDLTCCSQLLSLELTLPPRETPAELIFQLPEQLTSLVAFASRPSKHISLANLTNLKSLNLGIHCDPWPIDPCLLPTSITSLRVSPDAYSHLRFNHLKRSNSVEYTQMNFSQVRANNSDFFIEIVAERYK